MSRRLLVCSLALLGLAGTAIVVVRRTDSRDPGAAFDAWYSRRSVAAVPAEPPPGAKVVIVEFVDWRCASCQSAVTTLYGVVASASGGRPDQIYVSVRDYPLEPSCNRPLAQSVRRFSESDGSGRTASLPWNYHKGACAAAVAVRVASEHGRSEAMRHWVGSQTGDFDDNRLVDAAIRIGGARDFILRYASTLQAVQSDADLAGRLGVTSVPTMFINGRRIDGSLSKQFLLRAIQIELSR